MRIVRSSAPQVQVITLTNIKAYLNLNYDDSDVVVKLLLNQATELVENQTGIALRSSTYDQYFDYQEIKNILPFVYSPVTKVNSIISFNENNNPTEINPNTYYVEPQGNRLYFRTMPGDNYRPIDSLKINYDTGPDFNNVPADLLMTIYDLVAFFYDNRGNPDKNIPQSILSRISAYKDMIQTNQEYETDLLSKGFKYYVGF